MVVFGDGMGTEFLEPASVGERRFGLFVKLDPPIIMEGDRPNVNIQIRAFDPGSLQNYRNVTYYVLVYKAQGSAGLNQQEEPLLIDTFVSSTGPLNLQILPTEDFLEVDASKDPISGAWIASGVGIVSYKTPIVFDSGLYHIKITIFGVDSPSRFFGESEAPKFESWLSIGHSISRNIESGSHSYDVAAISFYDKITSDLEFDAESNALLWSIPFDWSILRLQQHSNLFVHQEVQIPKSFELFVGPSRQLYAKLNGEILPPGRVVLDPFSDPDNDIIHLLISRGDILLIGEKIDANNSQDSHNGIESLMKFTLFSADRNSGIPLIETTTSTYILTDSGNMAVSLSWQPGNLSKQAPSTLSLRFLDAISGKPIDADVLYDMAIRDNDGGYVYDMRNETAVNGTNQYRNLKFPANDMYDLIINVKGVSSQGGSSNTENNVNNVARGIVVVPEFPLSYSLMIIVLALITTSIIVGHMSKRIIG
jgi:hypothetical protein